jgi:hypothetical protein
MMKNFASLILNNGRFPGCLAIVFISLNAFWHFQNQSLPTFDSVRYWQQTLYLANSLDWENLRSLFQDTDPLLAILLSCFVFLFQLSTWKGVVILHGILVYPILFYSFYLFVQKYFSKETAQKSLVLFCLSPHCFHFGKVLIPEFLSFAVLLWTVHSWVSLAQHKSEKNFFKLLLGLALCFLCNKSILIYALSPVLILWVFLRNPSSWLFLRIACVLGLIFTYRPLFSMFVNPDQISSWASTEHLSYSAKFLWTAMGWMHTGGVLWSLLCLSGMVLLLRKRFLFLALGFAFVLCAFALLAWLRPESGQDLAVTGYRYQLPLLMVFSVLCAEGWKQFAQVSSLFCWILGPLLVLQTSLQSFPTCFPNLKLSMLLSGNLKCPLWDTSNQIVSGGGQSKAATTKPESRVQAENILTKVLEEASPNTPFWLTCLDPSQNLHFALTILCVEKKMNGFILGDFKNPWIPKSVKKDLTHIKDLVPGYRNLPNPIVFLKQSHFIVYPKKMEKTEPEIQNILDRMWDQVGSLKPDLTLLWESPKKDSLKMQLHHYPFPFPKNISKQNSSPKTPIFGLWLDARVQEYPWKEQRQVLETFFRKHKIAYESVPTEKMKAALMSSQYFTMVLPYGPYFPSDVIHEWILYYQRGGSFWFTGGVPFSKSVEKEFLIDAQCGLKKSFFVRRHLGFAPYSENSKNWKIKTAWPLKKQFQRIGKSVAGLEVRHGSRRNYFFGTDGNVFPFREECARFEPILEVQDSGVTRCVPIAFYDFFDNPYGEKVCSRVLTWGLDSLFHLTQSPKELEQWMTKITECFLTQDRIKPVPIPIPAYESALSSPPQYPLRIQESRLMLNGRSFFLGTNYYPSKNYDRFWLNPDFSEVDRDFRHMKKMRLELLRMHYIHSEWVSDFNRLFLGNRLKLNSVQDSLDTACTVLDLAQKYGLTVCFDLFSLVPEKLGSCKGWKHDTSRFEDFKKIEEQNIFLARFLEKTKNHFNFTIDLLNEPEIPQSHKNIFTRWVDEKVKIIKSIRPQILVTVGFRYPGIPIPSLDYYSVHCKDIPPLPYKDKPVLLQEFWIVETGTKKTWEKFSLGIYKAQKLGFAGVMPWGFSVPSTLYETEGASESWESHLGLFCRADGSWKQRLPWVSANNFEEKGI